MMQASDAAEAVLAAYQLGRTGITLEDIAGLHGRRLLVSMQEALTNREREVLLAVASGMSERAIAKHLNITYRTTRTHISNIMQKLGAENRTHAAVLALLTGLVDVHEVADLMQRGQDANRY